jgi:hypothetical protein
MNINPCFVMKSCINTGSAHVNNEDDSSDSEIENDRIEDFQNDNSLKSLFPISRIGLQDSQFTDISPGYKFSNDYSQSSSSDSEYKEKDNTASESSADIALSVPVINSNKRLKASNEFPIEIKEYCQKELDSNLGKDTNKHKMKSRVALYETYGETRRSELEIQRERLEYDKENKNQEIQLRKEEMDSSKQKILMEIKLMENEVEHRKSKLLLEEKEIDIKNKEQCKLAKIELFRDLIKAGIAVDDAKKTIASLDAML